MTHDNDLIRRIDAMQATQVGPSDEWAKATKSGYNQAATDIAMNILKLPAAPASVQIKPLVWHQYCRNAGNSSAKAFGGKYICERAGELGHFGLWFPEDGPGAEPRSYHPTIEAAKAAAQADYAARILAALDVPAPDVAHLTQVLQSLGKLGDDSLDAIVEVIGEGKEFATLNRGKEAMRSWFLGRINRIIAATQFPPAPSHDVAQIRAKVAQAIFDPGATEGYKGDRSLTDWQVDAVVRALIDTPPDAMAKRVAALVEAAKRLLDRDQINTCQHENTHRGGYLWEICDDCGRKWADDEGGKPEFTPPQEWIDVMAALAAMKGDAA